METTRLKRYLMERRITVTDAAEALGVTRPYLQTIVSGKAAAGRKLGYTIEGWTGGQVRMSDVCRGNGDEQ